MVQMSVALLDYILCHYDFFNLINCFHYRFSAMVQWMDAVDNSIKNILKELATAEEFEKEKSVFQVRLPNYEILHEYV
jgi:hypothetical protein